MAAQLARREDRERGRVLFERRLDDLCLRIGHRFARRELLRQAVTHASYSQEEPGRRPDYERLEFLGDRVLELAICDRLYRARPSDGEGDLTKRLAWLVEEENLLAVGQGLGLGEVVRIGPALSRERLPGSILADVVEALVGALYLDGGARAAERFAWDFIWDDDVLGPEPLQASPRNLLQERCARLRARHEVTQPDFACEASGPDDRRTHTCTAAVLVDGESFEAAGEGGSQKKAEKEAARVLLQRLLERFPDEP